MEAPAPQAIVFAIHGPIARGDLAGLCARVCALLGECRAGVAVADVAGVEADGVCVEALARLQLAARGHGCTVRLRHASVSLRELVAFMGLTDVLVDESIGSTGSAVPVATSRSEPGCERRGGRAG